MKLEIKKTPKEEVQQIEIKKKDKMTWDLWKGKQVKI